MKWNRSRNGAAAAAAIFGLIVLSRSAAFGQATAADAFPPATPESQGVSREGAWWNSSKLHATFTSATCSSAENS